MMVLSNNLHECTHYFIHLLISSVTLLHFVLHLHTHKYYSRKTVKHFDSNFEVGKGFKLIDFKVTITPKYQS